MTGACFSHLVVFLSAGVLRFEPNEITRKDKGTCRHAAGTHIHGLQD